jgi:hypothetical protein
MVVSKDGYRSESVVIESKSKDLWRNLIWIHPAGWLIGGIVDLSTGAARELEPGAVSVELRPVIPEVDPPVPGS